jgi:mRNA interferase RelE/StbE
VTYRLEIRPRARRYLAGLPRNLQRGIGRRIDSLAEDPRPPWSKPLHGDLTGRRSFRVGDYRVVYQIVDDVLLVLVIHIGPRGRVYGNAARGDI